MKFGKCKFYADENIEESLIKFIRNKGYRVISAKELGYNGRNDEFHLQQAIKYKASLLSKDDDYLDNRKFSFDKLQKGSIIVILTKKDTNKIDNFGYSIISLLEEIGNSGNKNIQGLKFALQGSKITVQGRYKGRIMTDMTDISKPQQKERRLFEN